PAKIEADFTSGATMPTQRRILETCIVSQKLWKGYPPSFSRMETRPLITSSECISVGEASGTAFPV
ncbi:MAG: hypothetical protein AAF191_21450, partial [Verrucomicrobiota bacterium]